MSFAPESETFAKPDVLLRMPVGLASPLWGLFAGAAMSGSAWWWMTRWARPENLEAIFGAPAPLAASPVEAEVPALEAPMEAANEAVAAELEPAPEPSPVVEAVVAPVVEAEPVLAEAVVAAEAEPAIVEPAPEPKPRVKKAEPKAD